MYLSRPIAPSSVLLAFCSATLATFALAQSPSVLEGFTSPYRDVHVGSSATTTAIGTRVDEGDYVKEGQILYLLDDAVLRAAVDVAREAASARGELEAAQRVLQAKQRRLEQTRDLHRRNHATPQELQTAENDRDEAAARVKAQEELIARRKQELHRTEAELQRMTVRSPLNGIVVERFREVGEVVSPADPHLVRIVQLDPLKVIATGRAKLVNQLHTGKELSILIDQEEHAAMIEYISPIVDAQSGMRKLHLRLPNPDNQIPSGVPCQIRVKDESLKQTASKRKTALQPSMPNLPTTHPFVR